MLLKPGVKVKIVAPKRPWNKHEYTKIYRGQIGIMLHPWPTRDSINYYVIKIDNRIIIKHRQELEVVK